MKTMTMPSDPVDHLHGVAFDQARRAAILLDRGGGIAGRTEISRGNTQARLRRAGRAQAGAEPMRIKRRASFAPSAVSAWKQEAFAERPPPACGLLSSAAQTPLKAAQFLIRRCEGD